MGRYRLTLGTFEDGQPANFAVRGRNVLIAGDPRSGKSWVAGLACEQLILQGYSVCVIDPEGDYRTLEPLPGVVVLGGDTVPPQLPDIARALRHPDMSAVIDLSHVPTLDKIAYLYSLLPMLAALRRITGLPHRIVVDEAHYFLHEPNVQELLDLNLGAYTLVTYRLTDLHPDVRKAVEAIIVKRITDPQEVRSLTAMTRNQNLAAEWESTLGSLAASQAALLPRGQEAGGQLRRFELLPRMTSHVRHRAKYLDVELVPEQAFVFTDNGKPLGFTARTLKEFVAALKLVPAPALDGHALRGDFSRWIFEVFHDHLLASDVRKLEHRYKFGHSRNLCNSLVEIIEERYEVS